MNIDDVIQVLLPQRPRGRVAMDAARSGTTLGEIIAKIVTDHYDGLDSSSDSPPSTAIMAPAMDFRVDRAFPTPIYPRDSIKLTQGLVDEAIKLGGITIQKRNRSIVFFPRFGRIDYVLSNRAERAGFVVSFYGSLGQFTDPAKVLKAGPKSYVRARVTSEQELEYIRPFVRQAYRNRFGEEKP